MLNKLHNIVYRRGRYRPPNIADFFGKTVICYWIVSWSWVKFGSFLLKRRFKLPAVYVFVDQGSAKPKFKLGQELKIFLGIDRWTCRFGITEEFDLLKKWDRVFRSDATDPIQVCQNWSAYQIIKENIWNSANYFRQFSPFYKDIHKWKF